MRYSVRALGDTGGVIVRVEDLVDADSDEEVFRNTERLISLGELSARVAHEIRNPVAIISGALAAAERDSTSVPMRAEMAAIARQECSRLERLTDEFLSYARGKYIARMDSEGIYPYFVFAYAGLLGWNAFNGTLTRASASIVENNRLVSKVYFPRLALPLSTCLTTLIDFAVALVLLVVMMAFFHIAPHWPALLLPAWLALLILLAIGIGLYTSALMVSYRDLQYALPPFLQLLLYASPVAYSAAAAPVPARLLRYYYLNPLAGLLEGFRWSVFGTTQVHWGAVVYSVVMVIVLFIFGAISFKRMERRFADVI